MALPFKILSKVALKIGEKEIVRRFKRFFTDTAITKVKNLIAKLKTTFQFDEFPTVGTIGKPKGVKTQLSNLFGARVTTTRNEDKENGNDLDKETEDDSDDITPIIVVTTAAVAGAIATATAAVKTKGDGFSMPDIDFKIPKKDGNKTFDINKFDFKPSAPLSGHPKGFTQGERINVQNTAGQFEYKRTQMPSAQYGNPLNIRPVQYKDKSLHTDKWEGLTGMHYIEGAGYFLAFSDPYYSFRAAARNIMSYQNKYGLYSVHEWLYKYCPTTDEYAGSQATQSYVNDVVQRANATGLVHINEYSRIDITDKNVYIAVLKGMAWHESNLNVSIDYLSKCYDAQFLGAPKPLQNTIVAKNGGGDMFTYQTSQYNDKTRQQYVERKVKKNNG